MFELKEFTMSETEYLSDSSCSSYGSEFRGGSSPSDRVRRVSCSVQILGEKNYNLKASILSSLKVFVKVFDRHA